MEGMKFRVLDGTEDSSEEVKDLNQQIDNNQDDLYQDDDNLDIDNDNQDDNEKDSSEENLDDARVLSYLKDRYQKEYDSLDDILSQKVDAELPEDVKKLMEFGVENYIKINKDWDKESPDNTLKEYYKQTKPHLDDEDIEYLLNEEYSFDEEYDDEKDVKKKKVALKEELFRAKEYLNDLKEQYKVELGSNKTDVSEDYKKAFDFYQDYTKSSKTELEVAQKKADVFKSKTEDLFSKEFKGFEFNLGDKTQVFKPKDAEEIKREQSDISNAINKHLSKDGTLKDAHQYHKALAMFRDPDGFAKFFYEQGKADATDSVVKNVKNIDMSVRDNKDVAVPSKTQMRVVSNDDFDGGVKIRKR